MAAPGDACAFFVVPEQQERMARNVKNIFTRRPLTSREVTTLHGVVAFLKDQNPP